MYKRKSLFVTFEGIEGSGKTYQSKKLFRKIKRMGLPVVYTREPGGTRNAEKIRRIILEDYFHQNSKEQFNKYTDTLLYLAARNEHIGKKIKPAISKKKIIICDRFTDSTLAYQVYGKRVSKILVDSVHKYILENIKPDITFILKANISRAMLRLKKRKKINRYDQFSKNFYNRVQKAFIKIAESNKRKYMIIDNSNDTPETEKIIFKKFVKIFNK
jgi:dTMP kinase